MSPGPQKVSQSVRPTSERTSPPMSERSSPFARFNTAPGNYEGACSCWGSCWEPLCLGELERI